MNKTSYLLPLLKITLVPLMGLLLSPASQAQEFPPKKTVTMVVGFAAGGAADTGARLIAKKLGENIGQKSLFASTPHLACAASSRGVLKFKTSSTAPIPKVQQFRIISTGFDFYLRGTAHSLRLHAHPPTSAPPTHPPATAVFIYVK
jgi:hypothetical protein